MILVMDSNLHILQIRKLRISKTGSDISAQGHMVVELELELLYLALNKQ